MRRFFRLTTAAALSLAAASTLAQADVSKFLPGDSLVVVKVSNLKETSDKIAKFTSKLGINMFVPQLANPLEALKTNLNIKGGINDAGELAFVFKKPAEGATPDQSMFILVPVSDYAAFVGGLENAKTEGEITSITPEGGKETYVASWGDYAVLSPDKAIVEAKPSDLLVLDGKAKENFAGSDAVIYSNLKELESVLGADLAKQKDKAKEQFLAELKDQPNFQPELEPLMSAAFDQGYGAVEAFVRDGKASTISLNFVEAGVTAKLVTEFKDGSYLKTAFSGLKNTDAPLTAGLPAGNYVAFGGMFNSSAGLQKIIDDFAGPILAEVPKDEKYAIVAKAEAVIKEFNAATKRVGFGALTPTGQIGKESLVQFVGFNEGDPVGLAKVSAEIISLQNEIQQLASGAEGLKYKSEVTKAGKTVAGVAFDEVATTFEADPNDPFAAQQLQAVEMMYGPGPLKQYTGISGDKAITFMGVSDETAAALVESAKANATTIASLPQVKVTSSNIAKSRFMEYYIGLDQIVTAGASAAGQMGMPVQFPPLPNDLEPIGITVGADQGALQVDGFVSTRLLQTLISAGMQVMGQMQGGGGGGGGPGGL